MKGQHRLIPVAAVALAVGATAAIEELRIDRLRRQLVKEQVESDWYAAASVIRIEDGRPLWYYDRSDRTQTVFMNRLRRVYMLSDPEGQVLERSDTYDHLRPSVPVSAAGPDPAVWEATRRDQWGTDRYVLCTGPVRDQNGRPYQLTVGRLRD